MQITRPQAVVILIFALFTPTFLTLVGFGVDIGGVHSMIAAIVLWAVAGIYLLVVAILMVTSHTARAFVWGTIRSIVTGQDVVTNSISPSFATSRETPRTEDRAILEGVDATLVRIGDIYHKVGEEAIAYSLDEYERHYLDNRKDYVDIIHGSANRNEAVLRGLERYFRRTFVLQPPLVKMGSRTQDVPVNPLLSDAETSHGDLRQVIGEMDSYVVRLPPDTQNRPGRDGLKPAS